MRSARNLIPMLAIGFVLGLGAMGLANIVFDGAKRLDETHLNAEKQSILQTLDTQILAWNSGDIEGFMQDYLKNDDLRFASGGDVQKGWEATLLRYQSRYPDRAAMGRLEFSDRQVQVLGTEDALIFGRWTLIRDKDRPTGLFTLHMKKQDGRWIIISDHTSSAQ
ncbi:MAG: DUF4440 domain-containing protein [Litorimonas sp.]